MFIILLVCVTLMELCIGMKLSKNQWTPPKEAKTGVLLRHSQMPKTLQLEEKTHQELFREYALEVSKGNGIAKIAWLIIKHPELDLNQKLLKCGNKTLLHILAAADAERPQELMEKVISLGAKNNALDSYGRVPLHYVNKGSPKIMRLLCNSKTFWCKDVHNTLPILYGLKHLRKIQDKKNVFNTMLKQIHPKDLVIHDMQYLLASDNEKTDIIKLARGSWGVYLHKKCADDKEALKVFESLEKYQAKLLPAWEMNAFRFYINRILQYRNFDL